LPRRLQALNTRPVAAANAGSLPFYVDWEIARTFLLQSPGDAFATLRKLN
jgi:hypothetical protein